MKRRKAHDDAWWRKAVARCDAFVAPRKISLDYDTPDIAAREAQSALEYVADCKARAAHAAQKLMNVRQ